MAETRAKAQKAFDLFVTTFEAKYPKATTCLTMVFKLAKLAESHWRALNGSVLLEDVIRGVKFVVGIMKLAA